MQHNSETGSQNPLENLEQLNYLLEPIMEDWFDADHSATMMELYSCAIESERMGLFDQIQRADLWHVFRTNMKIIELLLKHYGYNHEPFPIDTESALDTE